METIVAYSEHLTLQHPSSYLFYWQNSKRIIHREKGLEPLCNFKRNLKGNLTIQYFKNQMKSRRRVTCSPSQSRGNIWLCLPSFSNSFCHYPGHGIALSYIGPFPENWELLLAWFTCRWFLCHVGQFLWPYLM